MTTASASWTPLNSTQPSAVLVGVLLRVPESRLGPEHATFCTTAGPIVHDGPRHRPEQIQPPTRMPAIVRRTFRSVLCRSAFGEVMGPTGAQTVACVRNALGMALCGEPDRAGDRGLRYREVSGVERRHTGLRRIGVVRLDSRIGRRLGYTLNKPTVTVGVCDV